MSFAPSTTCKGCFRAEEVTGETDYLAQEYVYTCGSNDHGDTPYVWRIPMPDKDAKRSDRDSHFAEIGVYELLASCVHPDDAWLEYGVIEDRFRTAAPDLYSELVGRYSHSANNASRGGTDNDPQRTRTVSNRLARALGVLASEGLIAKSRGTATGYWSYNNHVSYWAPAPAADPTCRLTWADYATNNGLDPQHWPLPPTAP